MKLISYYLLLCLSILVSTKGLTMEKEPVKEAIFEKEEFVHLSNGYKVWTKRVGFGPIKILTLHGGPGCTHEYLKCFSDFLPPDCYQIIFYDQLGSFYSDQPEDTSLWTLERFCQEVEEVRIALQLDNFYLYGQSWGGLLAIEYALKFQEHLKGLIISNMTASVDSYLSYLQILRTQLPEFVQKNLKFFEDKEDFFNPYYEKIMFDEVYSQYICRLHPWPEHLQKTFTRINQAVYQTMQGPNEFLVTGNLKEWNRWDDLSSLHIPTLLIGGRFDTMNPKDIEKMGELIPYSYVKICENGSHLSMYDDQETYFRNLLNFLGKVEKDKKEALRLKAL